MSILNFPRLHFQGFARIHAPTGNKNGLVDLSTNTAYLDGDPFDHRRPASEYHEYLQNLGSRFNSKGQWDDGGQFSMAKGWDFGGNGHFSIEAKIVSTQRQPFEIDQQDGVVGRSVDLWGHHNEYLGTTFNRARIFDVDPASHWTNTIMLGQLAFGRRGNSHEVPYMLSAPVNGLQPARWQNFNHIQNLPPHCLNPEFQRAAVYQFTVAKTDPDFLWGEEIGDSVTVSLLREAMSRDDILGLVVQLSLSNMSTPTQPDAPSFWSLSGTIGLWCSGEMKTYPHGRLLTPRQIPERTEQLANLTVKVTPHHVSLNMVIALPWVGRAAKAEAAPTHKLEGKLDLGELELRTLNSNKLIASIPPYTYNQQAHQLTSGIFDVPLAEPWENLGGEIEQQGLCLVNKQGQILLQEEEINLQVDDACLFLEFPDPKHPDDYAVELEVRSFVRGKPHSVDRIHLEQFYNPRGLPQLRYEFEKEPANADRSFHFPRSHELSILHFKPGKGDEAGEYHDYCTISTNEQGSGWVTLKGAKSGTTRVLLSTQGNAFPWDTNHADEAIIAYDNDNKLGFWSGVGSFGVRVLTDDWDLLRQTEDRAVDFHFIYEHILAFYEHTFSFMKAEVFSLEDRCKVETYARLTWQMSDPKNKNKTYYMPPTRDMSKPKALLLRKFLRNQQQVGYVPDSQAVPKSTQRTLQTREQLVTALKHAAELEAALMLQYIFAGYSIPNYVTGEEYVRRGLWTQKQLHLACGDGQEVRNYGMRGVLLEIAHEEMIHFLMVNNILMAMGEPFYPAVPNFKELNRRFPIDVDFALEPLNATTIQRFIRFEYPDFLEQDLVNDTSSGDGTADELHSYGSLSELYRQIREGIQHIDNLFILKQGNVGGDHHLFLRADFNKVHPDYQFQVEDLESALFAIDVIVEQGEGCNPQSPQFEKSHFQQFCRVAEAMARQQNSNSTVPWNPAYPVIRNPTLHYQDRHTNVITVPQTRAVMEIFNECYFLMMQLMVQHFGLMPTASLRRSKLMNASIDVMTGMMRPLGELLMTLPSGKRGKTAGVSFEIETPMYIPTPEVAYESISRRFEGLGLKARECEVINYTIYEMFDFYVQFFLDLANKIIS